MLVALPRGKGDEGRQLVERICELELTERRIQALCAHYLAASTATRRKIAEDPGKFLKALEVAGKGRQDPALSEAENRVLKQLELMGNVALGVTRNLAGVMGYDAGTAARAVLWAAWEKTAKRWAFLEEAAEGLRAAQEKHKEAGYAQSGSSHGDYGAARAGPRQPEDCAGFGSEPDGGQGSSGQRAAGGVAVVAAAPS